MKFNWIEQILSPFFYVAVCKIPPESESNNLFFLPYLTNEHLTQGAGLRSYFWILAC